MVDILFYVFAGFMLLSALWMVISPNAVNGAMAMIVSFVSTAALFVLLEAYFLAVLQVLVYAGAVMVLFLFIIMLLDVDKDTTHMLKDKLTLISSVVGLALFTLLVAAMFNSGNAHLPDPTLVDTIVNPTGTEAGIPFTTSAKSFGYSLFTKYMLPFQVAGFLLLAAMIGVIVVSKRHEETSV